MRQYWHFNSIKVQLELMQEPDLIRSLRFQFHKGTIRTLSLDLAKVLLLNFNSIKVQLELYPFGYALRIPNISIP